MNARAWVSILAVIVLAGCAGDSAPNADPSGTIGSAASATASGDLGSISGTVTNDEMAPIGGATVGIPASAIPSATTDAAGRFTFNNIEPGTYSVFAEQLGYESRAQKVTVVAGEVAKVTFVLESIALPGVARQLNYQADGFVELAVVAPQAGVTYFNITGENLNFIVYRVAPDAASAVMGLKWDNTVPGTGRYTRINTFTCKPASSCTQQNFTRGFSPILIRTDNLQEALEGKDGYFVGGQFYPTTCTAISNEFCASNPDTVVSVAFQQRYKFYTSVFHVEPAPQGFSPLPP